MFVSLTITSLKLGQLGRDDYLKRASPTPLTHVAQPLTTRGTRILILGRKSLYFFPNLITYSMLVYFGYEGNRTIGFGGDSWARIVRGPAADGP